MHSLHFPAFQSKATLKISRTFMISIFPSILIYFAFTLWKTQTVSLNLTSTALFFLSFCRHFFSHLKYFVFPFSKLVVHEFIFATCLYQAHEYLFLNHILNNFISLILYMMTLFKNLKAIFVWLF